MANSKLLIEDTSQEYEISQNDVLIYAQQIGIDVSTETHLMWIAEKGLSAKVPKPWQIIADEKDRIYYYNPKTFEKSWHHPLDKHYAALVSEERTKTKSLNSASSDYGFESKLSSLADAPPLSSSGKNSPLPFSQNKKDGGLSRKKLEFGRIENRRGTQLAPVRLNTLKMPAAPVQKSGSGMSFMPKGSTLSRNIKRGKEDIDSSDQFEGGLDYEHPQLDDSNESSADGSKYSYEEIDDDKQIHELEPYDMLDTSHLSPMHSADESPDALDINSLVQLGTKLPSRFDSSFKQEHLENMYNKENSSLSLRKVGQPSFLKPITHTGRKKSANKNYKTSKKVKKKIPVDNATYLDNNISSVNDEQQMMLEEIQKEWLAMQNDLEKKEKEKYEEMLKDSTKKLEEEEKKLRQENFEKILKIKSDLQKKIEEEEHSAKMSLQAVKESNKEKISEEEKKLQKELETLSKSFKVEIEKMEKQNALELSQRKDEFDKASAKELENLKVVLNSHKTNIEDAHAIEILNLQQLHKKKIDEIKNAHKEEQKINNSLSQECDTQGEIQRLEKSIKDENEKHQVLLKEKENLLKEINSENNCLEELKKEISKAQTTVEELQDEIEKTENDLDLLRSEKSGLISELNILKENIVNQKSSLSNLEKEANASFHEAGCSKELSDVAVATDLTFINTICKAVQVSISCCDVSSQIDKVTCSVLDAICQTVVHATADKSCQTNLVPSIDHKNVDNVSSDRVLLDSRTILDKNLEDALSGLSMKLDSKINVIENQLRLLQKNLSSESSAKQPIYSSQEFVENQFSTAKTLSNAENRTIPPIFFSGSSVPLGHPSNSIPVCNQSKCNCELGEPASCKILQDVKNSVYRLNDILCTNFVPPLSNSNFSQISQAVNSYSSPYDNFYAQFRQMQEKHRLAELKHKCDDDAVKFAKSSSNLEDAKSFGNFHSIKPSYYLMPPDMCSFNVSEDPLIRARSIVLREKAKAWKEQQSLNASVPHFFSMKSSSGSSQSSVTGFTSPFNVPSSEQTFLNFDVDPETDYNMWMTRLNALHLRIRSHKMF